MVQVVAGSISGPSRIDTPKLRHRDYPARFNGDYTLTPNRLRAAQFHVEDIPAQVAAELTATLGIRAHVLAADELTP